MAGVPPIKVTAAKTGNSPGYLPFTSNCPRFQDEAQVSNERFKLIFAYFEDVTKEFKKFKKAGLALSKAEEALANILIESESMEHARDEFSGSPMSPTNLLRLQTTQTTQPLLGELMPVMSSFGHLLMELSKAQEMCLEGLQQSFLEPLEAHTRDEAARLHTSKKTATNAYDAHQSALRKYLQGGVKPKPGIEDVIDQRAADLSITHAEAENARFNHAKVISTLRGEQYLCMTDSVLSTVASMMSYHRQCADLVDSWGAQKNEIIRGQETVRAALLSDELLFAAQERDLLQATALAPVTIEASKRSDGGLSGLAGSMGVASPPPSGGGFRGGAAAMLASAVGKSDAQTKQINVPKALEKAEEKHESFAQVQRLYEGVYTPRYAPRCVREGYLFKRSNGKVMHQWRRRWFVLEGSRLYYLKGGFDKETADVVEPDVEDDGTQASSSSHQRVLVCDVLLATVRDKNDGDVPYCFEIYSANRRSYMLQAEGPIEFEGWTSTIRQCIADQLSGAPSKGGPGSGDEGEGGNGLRARPRSPGQSAQSPSNPVAAAVALANQTCADCGSPSPDWVSLNLGTVICIGCSGIHRSLGTHISKVRSLALDALTELDLCVALKVGNEMSNKVWEAVIQEGWTKPSPDATREIKQSWIQAKYVFKGFLDVKGHDSTNGIPPADALLQACESDDVFGAYCAIVAGADMKAIIGDPSLGRVALHVAAASGSVNVCAYLFLNGADLHVHDSQQMAPLDVAVLSHQLPVIEYLQSKMDFK